MKRLFNKLMFKIGYVPVKTQVVNINIESIMRDVNILIKDEAMEMAYKILKS